MTITQGDTTVAEMYITYGEAGPLYIEYNGTIYYYILNGQGDVVGLAEWDVPPAVLYTYNAWGEIESVSGTKASTLGMHNPLRYRGYVYDTETELYYLNSRYYNPEWGRFINSDVYISTGQGALGYNMFAYCNNSPVNACDPSGEDAIWIQHFTMVPGAGHTGLLLEDGNGSWWYFFWGRGENPWTGKFIVNVEVKKKENFGYYLSRYGIRSAMDRFGLSDYGGYIYLFGDFDKSVDHVKYLNNKRFGLYDLLANNCLQKSIDVLMKGTFDEKNIILKAQLLSTRKTIIPNMAYSAFKNIYNSLTKKRFAPNIKPVIPNKINRACYA